MSALGQSIQIPEVPLCRRKLLWARNSCSRVTTILIAFVIVGAQIRKILDHIGVDSEPPQIPPARGPPLWDDCSDAQTDEAVHIEPDWDLAAQPAPDFEVDQRVNW